MNRPHDGSYLDWVKETTDSLEQTVLVIRDRLSDGRKTVELLESAAEGLFGIKEPEWVLGRSFRELQEVVELNSRQLAEVLALLEFGLERIGRGDENYLPPPV